MQCYITEISTRTSCVGTNCLLKHAVKRKLEGTGRRGDVSSYWVTLKKLEDAGSLKAKQ